MKYSIAQPATAFVLSLFAATSAYAEEVKYDRTIEAMVIAKAAGKVGEIRPSIDWDKQVTLVTRKQLLEAVSRRMSLVPSKLWIPPKPENPLPPMVSNGLPGVDFMSTAGIRKADPANRERIIWEKFDADGNRID